MTTPNHIAGGLVITGLFGSFMQLNILASPWYIFLTVVGSILPDIDHTRSIIGKVFLPLSRWLNRRFGHRTITHSLMALLSLSLILAFFEAHILESNTIAKIFFLAYSSHLILDMTTVQGVPLLYPFLKNPCVMPGNPDLRFRTGHFQTETMIFCFFLLSGIFLQPLFNNGFWTQYNRFFGTPKHLASEFRKSDDALLVKYWIKKGTEHIRGQGICVEANDNKIVLLKEEGFHHLDNQNYAILEVIPEHTGQALRFETIHFVDINVDSLNQLIQHSDLQKIELQANSPFLLHHQNRKVEKRQVNLEYPADFWLEEIKKVVSKPSFKPYINPRIKTLERQIELLEKQFAQQLEQYHKQQEKLEVLTKEFNASDNLTNQERLLSKIKSLKNTTVPRIDQSKIENIQLKIKELKWTDRLTNEKQWDQMNDQLSKSKTLQTRYTGMITKISISNQRNIKY